MKRIYEFSNIIIWASLLLKLIVSKWMVYICDFNFHKINGEIFVWGWWYGIFLLMPTPYMLLQSRVISKPLIGFNLLWSCWAFLHLPILEDSQLNITRSTISLILCEIVFCKFWWAVSLWLELTLMHHYRCGLLCFVCRTAHLVLKCGTML